MKSIRRQSVLKMYAPYFLLTAAIMLPLLAPGYILTLDAVFVPHLAAPTLGNDYVWRMLLHILNLIVPSQIIEKTLFVGILLLASIGMHRLVLRLSEPLRHDKTLAWGAAPYIAGLLFAVNPYTYDRFMAGQYGVLLGYALLPFAVRLLLAFAERPGRTEMLRLGLLTAGIGIVSLPTLGEVGLAAVCILGVAAWQHRQQKDLLRLYALRGLAAAGLFLLLSSYWLLPLALGKGAIATSLQQFDSTHTAAFATAGSGFFGRLANVLRLQGFWVEAHHLFVLPQTHLPGWGTVRLLVWALVIGGAVVCWRRARGAAIMFTGLGLGSALLAAGLFAVPLTHIGYREPQKFAGLLALAFAVFTAFGTARLIARTQARSNAQAAISVVALIALIILFTPTMFWGFGGQLRSREYPTGWFTINTYLRGRQGDFDTVFLPWHQYMSFDFAGRIIANPAPRFFERPVISSNDPELGSIAPLPGTITTIGRLVAPGRTPLDLADRLAARNVRYIILAKDYDYRRWLPVVQRRDLVLVRDTSSISLYENTAWKEGGTQ